LDGLAVHFVLDVFWRLTDWVAGIVGHDSEVALMEVEVDADSLKEHAQAASAGGCLFEEAETSGLYLGCNGQSNKETEVVTNSGEYVQ
jgi:hypothetical protein